MRNRISAPAFALRALLCAALFAFCASSAAAQMRRESSCSVVGHVTAPANALLSQYSVLLESVRDHVIVARTSIEPSGDFQTGLIPSGEYQLRLEDGAGVVAYQRYLSLDSIDNLVEIQLDSPLDQSQQPVTGTVSVSELSHKVPGKARKEFAKAEQANQAGDIQASIRHLKKAIEIDPAYLEAYNNLGVGYLKLNQWAPAADEFRRAAELDPNAPLVFSNLSVALFSLNRLPQAEEAARRAVKLDGGDNRARLMLGLILAALRKDDAEALLNLRHVGDEFPIAHVSIAQVLARQGHQQQAIDELRAYLRSGKARNPQQVETWIAQMQSMANSQ